MPDHLSKDLKEFTDIYFYRMKDIEVTYIKNFLRRLWDDNLHDRFPYLINPLILFPYLINPLILANLYHENPEIFGLKIDDLTELEMIIMSMETALDRYMNFVAVKEIILPISKRLEYEPNDVWVLKKEGYYTYLGTEFRPSTNIKDALLLKEFFDIGSPMNMMLSAYRGETGFICDIKQAGITMISTDASLESTAITASIIKYFTGVSIYLS